MTTRFRRLLVAAFLLAFASIGLAQDDHAYTEGPVTQISHIKVKPGQFDAYMRYLAGNYKKVREEQKKAGLVLEYHIYQAAARSPHDPDLYLTVTYKNWAAFDGLTAKLDAINKQMYGSLDKSTEASVDREKMRESLGGQIVQELILK